MESELVRWAEKRDYRIAWFGGAAVRAAFERIDRLKAGGFFNPAFFKEFLSWLDQPDIRTRSEVRTVLLVGCLVCQEICPVNKGRLKFEKLSTVFSSEETAYIIGERGDGLSSPQLVDKVRALGCTEIEVTRDGPNPVFRRNLRAALRLRRWN
jgi:hypothetical protein